MAMVTVRLGDGRLYSIPEEMLNTMGMDQTMGMMPMETNDFRLFPTLPTEDNSLADIYPYGERPSGEALSITPVNNVDSQALANLQEQTRLAEMLQKDRQYSPSMNDTMAGLFSESAKRGVLTGGADSQVGVDSQAGTATSRGQGILDRLLGSELPETYGLLDEQQMQEAQSRARDEGLLNASVALLRAGAPQTTRVGIGEAIASAMQAGRQATGDIYDQRLKQAVFMNELAEKREAKELAETQQKQKSLLSGMVLDYPKFGTLQDKQKFLERVTDIAVRQYQIDPILVGQVLSTLNPLQDQKDLEAIIKQKNERNPDQLRKKVKDALNLTEGQAKEITDNQLKTLRPILTNYELAPSQLQLEEEITKRRKNEYEGVKYDDLPSSKSVYMKQMQNILFGSEQDSQEQSGSQANDMQSNVADQEVTESPQDRSSQQEEVQSEINTTEILNPQWKNQLEEDLTGKALNEQKDKLLKEHSEITAYLKATIKRNKDIQQSLATLLADDESMTLLTADEGGTVGSFVTNVAREIREGLPSSRMDQPMARAKMLIYNIVEKAGLAGLQQMRSESPTGGAVGNVTEKELGMFQRTIGQIRSVKTKKDLEVALKDAQKMLTEQAQILSGRYKATYNANYKTQDGESWTEFMEGYQQTRDASNKNVASETTPKITVKELQGLSEKERNAIIEAELQRRKELKRRRENNDNENQSRDNAVSFPEQAIMPAQRQQTSERTFEPELPMSLLQQIAPSLSADGARRIFNDFLDVTDGDVDRALQMFRKATNIDDYGLL